LRAALFESIFEEDGFQSYSKLTGGDINSVFRVETSPGIVVVKFNSNQKYPNMFEKEHAGLDLLSEKSNFKVPKVFRHGSFRETAYIVMEYIEPGRGSYPQHLAGKSLAELHSNSALQYGLDSANYIGSINQQNTWTQNWNDFFINQRILPLLEFCDSHFSKNEHQRFDLMFKKLHEFFPDAKPSLLHGDLWSGNTFADSEGRPVIYDPAVYYGHYLMDLGMTKLFGGFSSEFYNAYSELRSLENNWEQACEIANLYPLMVHLALFGSSYKNQITQVLSTYF
jgi:protein-ribulosamine 3-kinase